MLRLNGKEIVPTIFPDNTSQIWKIPRHFFNENGYNVVEWKFENEGEFLQLAQLKSLLDSYYIPADLYLKYLPYGRQDKPVSNDATFGLSTFAQLLNTLAFRKVIILDPHSSVATNLIKNSIDVYSTHIIKDAIFECKIDVICYPDKGAYHKYPSKLQLSPPIIYGEKVRDQATGNIISYNLKNAFLNLKDTNTNVLIVDDICDGGMTFKILAKELLANGAKEVHLFVTHGIFSKGLETLRESGIQRIYTQDGEKR